MRTFSAWFLALLLSVGSQAWADGEPGAPRVPLRDGHPQVYTVQPGDTLWDIASRFLQDPWRWKEIWRANPNIRNPDLIYPGDQIGLITIDGEPRLQVNARGRPVVKLSPQVRVVTERKAIPALDVETLKGYFELPRVMTRAEYNAAPYVLKPVGEHLIVGRGDRVYVRGLSSQHNREFGIFRMGQAYKLHPDDKEELGREIVHVGEGYIERWGDPATLRIDMASEEIIQGLRVLPADPQDTQLSFVPTAPDEGLKGSVMAFMDGLFQGGVGQIMALDIGREAGVQRGHVFGVFIGGDTIDDKVAGAVSEKITLPQERIALAMVFRVYDKVAYALITSAKQPVHTGDKIGAP